MVGERDRGGEKQNDRQGEREREFVQEETG